MTVLRSDSGETHVRRHATWGMYAKARPGGNSASRALLVRHSQGRPEAARPSEGNAMTRPVRYAPEIEVPVENEAELIDEIWRRKGEMK